MALVSHLRVWLVGGGSPQKLLPPLHSERIVEAQQRERVIEASATTLSNLTEVLEAQPVQVEEQQQ